ncbi:MAG: hypothetical protein PVI86_08935 [Phycisphaerae bacterium]
MIAVCQEDADLKTHAQFLRQLKTRPRFEIVADVGRRMTMRYRRTTAHLIDKQGTVRQIFPMLIHSRPSWSAIRHEVEELHSETCGSDPS